MKVDYHLHLEEGPYSIGWLAKINEALNVMNRFKKDILLIGL